MLLNLRDKGKLATLLSYETYKSFWSNSSSSATREKRDFDAMMSERFENLDQFRADILDIQTEKNLSTCNNPALDDSR